MNVHLPRAIRPVYFIRLTSLHSFTTHSQTSNVSPMAKMANRRCPKIEPPYMPSIMPARPVLPQSPVSCAKADTVAIMLANRIADFILITSGEG